MTDSHQNAVETLPDDDKAGATATLSESAEVDNREDGGLAGGSPGGGRPGDSRDRGTYVPNHPR